MAAKGGFLGTGLTAPLSLNVGRGISTQGGQEDIEQSIRLILGTRLGERVMRPSFGCRVHEYVFAPNNSSTHANIRDAVFEALKTNENRIEDIVVDVKPDSDDLDRVNVKITFKVRTVNHTQNLVYPFYLQGS